jgi:hypothetical protein
MCRSWIVRMTVTLVAFVSCSSCWYKERTETVAPLVVTIDWQARPGGDDTFPAYSLTGKLLTNEKGHEPPPFKRVGALEQIGGLTYVGFRLYYGPGADKEDPKALVFELLMRRLADPTPAIDIRLSSTVECRVNFDNFDGGTLQDAITKEELAWPVLLAAGDYRLEAVKD